MTLWKVNIYSIGKEPYQSVVIIAKLWLMLSVKSIFLLIRYLILSQLLSHQLSNNTKYAILLWILINRSVLSYLIRNGFPLV